MPTVTLTGTALRHEATRLNIPGRSKMTADQLREAVSVALTPPTPPVPSQRPRVAPPAVPTNAPATITPTVFAARWGKRKSSLNGRVRRSR